MGITKKIHQRQVTVILTACSSAANSTCAVYISSMENAEMYEGHKLGHNRGEVGCTVITMCSVRICLPCWVVERTKLLYQCSAVCIPASWFGAPRDFLSLYLCRGEGWARGRWAVHHPLCSRMSTSRRDGLGACLFLSSCVQRITANHNRGFNV